MMTKLIRMITGKAKGRYLLRLDNGDIIHPNGYVSRDGVLPWNGQWVESTRLTPKWTEKYS